MYSPVDSTSTYKYSTSKRHYHRLRIATWKDMIVVFQCSKQVQSVPPPPYLSILMAPSAAPTAALQCPIMPGWSLCCRVIYCSILQPTHHHGHFLTDIIPLTSVLEIVPPGCRHLPELVEVLCLRPVPVHLRVQQVGLAVALAGAGVTSPEYKQ